MRAPVGATAAEVLIERYENSILSNALGENRVVIRTGHAHLGKSHHVMSLGGQSEGYFSIEHLVQEKP